MGGRARGGTRIQLIAGPMSPERLLRRRPAIPPLQAPGPDAGWESDRSGGAFRLPTIIRKSEFDRLVRENELEELIPRGGLGLEQAWRRQRTCSFCVKESANAAAAGAPQNSELNEREAKNSELNESAVQYSSRRKRLSPCRERRSTSELAGNRRR